MKLSAIAILILSSALFSACNKCYTCTAIQNGDEISRDVCGTKANRQPFIDALEQDTTGVGPWVCTKK